MKHFPLLLISALGLGATLVCSPCKLQAQAEPGATRAGALQVGATVSFLKPSATGYLYPDATPTSAPWSVGGTAFATFDLTHSIGATVEIGYPDVRTPDDFLEKTYLIGGRYVYHYRRYAPYGKILGGVGKTSYDRPVGWINFPGTPATYGVFAYGAGLDYSLSPHINLRAIDFEAQHWSGYPGGAISPYTISIGAAFRFR